MWCTDGADRAPRVPSRLSGAEGGAWQEFELERDGALRTKSYYAALAARRARAAHPVLRVEAPSAAGRACKQLAALAADDAVWRALYERRWSHQLIEPEGIDRRLWNVDPPLPMDMPKTHRELFHCRLTNGVYLRVVEGVHYFTGTAADQYDGNVTPISASIGMKGMQLTGHVRRQRRCTTADDGDLPAQLAHDDSNRRRQG